MVVEVDGDQHVNNRYDQDRDSWIRDQGFTVLRLWNSEVSSQIDMVMDSIVHAIEDDIERNGPAS